MDEYQYDPGNKMTHLLLRRVVEVAQWSSLLLLFPIPLEQESLHQVHLTFPHSNVTGLDLQTTVAGKCPSSLEDEQEKQGDKK
ncbi:hypothetical protein TNCV_3541501 [Trichonephila clavipes]|nr:hypothetical protein TNCV_3541501 [Trichonephila clavipes]